MTERELSTQEIFDKVVTHLRTQGERAVIEPGSNQCMYRAPNGFKCAAGCLIKDEFYTSALENKFADCPAVEEALQKSGVNMAERDVWDLVVNLQTVHDNSDPCFWEKQLSSLAKRFDLNMPA